MLAVAKPTRDSRPGQSGQPSPGSCGYSVVLGGLNEGLKV
jgi:hypothetical protein